MLNEVFKLVVSKVAKSFLAGKLYENNDDPLKGAISQNTPAKPDKDDLTEGFPKNKTDLLESIGNRFSSQERETKYCSSDLLKNVTFEREVHLDDVLYSLRNYGVAIFPSLIKGDQLKRLQNEFKLFMSKKQRCVYNKNSEGADSGNSLAMDFKRSQLNERLFPEMAKLFGSETLFAVCSNYFSGQDFEFNGDMFIQSTGMTSKPMSGELHWDKQLTLKSWIYVSEATEGYGAMRASLGSASWTRYAREDAMFYGIKYNRISNQVEVDGSTIISTGGPAGTFFIFVSDTPHGATQVTEGNTREIIRSEARPTRIKEWAAWANR